MKVFKQAGQFAIALIALLLLAPAAWAQFTFTTNNGAITITGYTGAGGNVTIPSTTNGYPVTTIGTNAFYTNNNFASVIIPDSVTSIGSNAFYKCTNLTNATIGNGVTNIDNQAFYNCSALTNLTIGNSVTSIGINAFVSCWNLQSVTIPNSVTNVGDMAFASCSSMKNLSIGNHVTSLGQGVFSYCTNLTSVIIPNSVNSIGLLAFVSCSGLTSAVIGSGVTNMGQSVFPYCPKLNKVIFQGNAPTVNGGAGSADTSTFYNESGAVYYLTNTTGWGATFGGWSAVCLNNGAYLLDVTNNYGFITINGYVGPGGDVNIPGTIAGLPVTTINFNAFRNIKTITSVELPNSVNYIADDAFQSCSGLTNVTIGGSVTNLGIYAFAYCTNLHQAFFQGNAPMVDGTAGSADGSVFYGEMGTAYYQTGATGWGATYGGWPTVLQINSLLGTINLLEGPAAGSDSVVLATNKTWTATANATWLHLSAANQSGTASTNVIFSFDANPGATRTGTLTIAGQMLTITQAGSTYVATTYATATNMTTLVSAGLSLPNGVAADGAGNIYIADFNNNAIKEWITVSNTVTTLVSSGLNHPFDVAVDSLGNVYIADTSNNAIKKWTATNNTVTTLISSGLSSPNSLAVDGAGNVYIADSGHNAIKEWTAANSNVTTLVSVGLNSPLGVAVDIAGNVYIADSGNSAIKEWTAVNSNLTTLVSSGLNYPPDVAVDGAGNVYIADSYNNAVKKWTAVSNTVTTLVSSGFSSRFGIGVDVAGNIYIANGSYNAIKEMCHVFVDSTAETELAAAGSDTLPVVLPASANLTGPFAPTSDSSWLAITGVTNGVVSFAFAANNSSKNRTAHINVLGQSIAVTQLMFISNLLEGPAAGSDSVVLAVTGAWTATANASWLHLSAANQSGPASTNVIFSFDANSGAMRTGTLTIANQTLTITQAGATYIVANPVTTLVASGLASPISVAVDGAGNVYIADEFNNMIKEWIAASNIVNTLVNSVSTLPLGVATDGAGNVYIADGSGNAIKEWTAASNTVSTLVSLSFPSSLRCVAVDGAGNAYFGDTYNNTIKKWTSANNTLTTNVSSGLNYPAGVAVDGVGNVYIADSSHNAIKKWTAANSNLTTLVSSGLNFPASLTVDGSGNVYIADTHNNLVKEWVAASNTVTTLVSSGLNTPYGVAVDGAGNVYIADFTNKAIKAVSRAFVDATAKTEPAFGGSDTLPVVLPATANLTGPFAPTSDSAWLTITGCNNGVVGFAVAANYTTNRTGHISLLGQSIAVTQPATTPLILSGCKTFKNGSLQFGFSNNLGLSFTVWTSTNMLLPFTNWTLLGTATNNGSGQYGFNDPFMTNGGQRFYRVTSP